MELLYFILKIFGPILFFLPGILLCYILFPKIKITERIVYSIVLAFTISLILGYILSIFNGLTLAISVLSLVLIIFLFSLFLILMNKKLNTLFDKNIFYVLFFTIIGVIWKLFFVNLVSNSRSTYAYVQANISNVSDLGFYSGMVSDHLKYSGGKILQDIYSGLVPQQNVINLLLITFIFLGFIYFIFKKFRNKKLAYLGVAIMAFAPLEIFHSTLGVVGHPLSYIAFFSLFLLFIEKEENYFVIPLLLSISMFLTYYTASMIILISSLGFLGSLFFRDFYYENWKFKIATLRKFVFHRKTIQFFVLIVLSLLFIFFISQMGNFTKEYSAKPSTGSLKKSYLEKEKINRSVMENNFSVNVQKGIENTRYKDPHFFGISAIRFQMIFFFLCSLTFVYSLFIKKLKNLNKKEINLIACLVPASILMVSFIYSGYPTRGLDYICFFGLLVLKIPKKYFRLFFIFSLLFIIVTGFQVMHDKKIFFDTPEGEIHGAIDIKNNFNGKMFSDQRVINNLVLEGYFNVTGADDEDPIVYGIFYEENETLFLKNIERLSRNNIKYIGFSKRMEEKYILMLDYPQKPIKTADLFEKNFEKVYDNGDVRLYNIEGFKLNENFEKICGK